jgi:hypothetical protein
MGMCSGGGVGQLRTGTHWPESLLTRKVTTLSFSPIPKFAFPNSNFLSPTSRATSGSLNTELVFWRDKVSQSEIHSNMVSERFTREGGNSSANSGFSIGVVIGVSCSKRECTEV